MTKVLYAAIASVVHHRTSAAEVQHAIEMRKQRAPKLHKTNRKQPIQSKLCFAVSTDLCQFGAGGR